MIQNTHDPESKKYVDHVKSFISSIDSLSLSKAFESAFECFYDKFIEKGVISVEGGDRSKENSQNKENDSKSSESNEKDAKDSKNKPKKEYVKNNEKICTKEEEEENADKTLPLTQKNGNKKSKVNKAKENLSSEEDNDSNENDEQDFENDTDEEDSETRTTRKTIGTNESCNFVNFEDMLTKMNRNGEVPCFLFQPDTNVIRKSRKLLPPNISKKEYTLVLDLDETLIHFEENPNGQSQFLIRPYAPQFIKKVSQYYEVVIFTAALQEYADFILDRLDTQKCISYRLYRHHTNLEGNVYQKDLSRIGRDLAKTLIIDNNAENFQLQPDNGIYIKSWYNDPEDKALTQLAPILIGKFLFSYFFRYCKAKSF